MASADEKQVEAPKLYGISPIDGIARNSPLANKRPTRNYAVRRFPVEASRIASRARSRA